MTADQPDIPRDPHSDKELLDHLDELDTPSQGMSSGGRLQRDVGTRDEEKNALDPSDPLPTSVHKSERPDGGDKGSYSGQDSGNDAGSPNRAPPRRT